MSTNHKERQVDIFVIAPWHRIWEAPPDTELAAVGDVINDYVKDQRHKACIGCSCTLDTDIPPFAFVVAHWPDSPDDGDTSVEALCEECSLQDDSVDVINRHLETLGMGPIDPDEYHVH